MIFDFSRKIKIIDWQNLPNNFSNSNLNEMPAVHYCAQTLALNDCLYRSKHESQYVIFVDIDEFVSLKNQKIVEFVDKLVTNHLHVAGVVLQNQFVSFEVKNISDDIIMDMDCKIYPHRERSKFIVRPELVDKISVHEISGYTTGLKRENVEILLPYNEGAVFHNKPGKAKLQYFACNECRRTAIDNVIPDLAPVIRACCKGTLD